MSKNYDPSLQFQTIQDAARTTGLSQYFIRRGCWDNSIPHIRVGTTKYLVNVPLMLKRLSELSEMECK